MTDIALPSGLCPARVTWTLERNRALEESPYSRVVQTQGRPGDRWRATASWPVLFGDEANALSTWLDQVSKPGNHALVPVAQNDMTGTESGSPAFADLVKPWRENQFAGWGSKDLLVQPYLNNGKATIYGNQNPPSYISKGFAVTTGIPHIISLDVPPALNAFRMTAIDGAGVLFDSGLDQNLPGRREAEIVPRTANITIFLYSANDTIAFARSLYGDLRLHRSYRAQDALAAGRSDGRVLGGSISLPEKAMKAGQFIYVNTTEGRELKRLTNNLELHFGVILNGNNLTHVGRLEFEPPLRGSLAINSPIYHHSPVCRMRLATAVSSADITPPLLHGFSVDFVEEL